MEIHDIESAVEGILFASGEPVSCERMAQILEIDKKELVSAVSALAGRYRFERRGIRIVELDGSYQMTSAPEQAEYIRKALDERKPPLLSKSALEVLSLVAYYQPITRADIEKVRGVDSSYTVASLVDKKLLEEAGRMDVIGRPILYRTTPAFLRSFGLSRLEELPELSELEGQLVMEGGVLDKDTGE